MTAVPRNRFARFAGALTAIVLIGGSAALAASIGVTSSKLTVFTKAGPTSSVDTTAPALQTLEMFDVDANGFVDRVVATFNETLQPSTSKTAWALTDIPSSNTFDSVSTSGMQATLVLAKGTGVADTAGTAFRVALSFVTSEIRDTAGNKSSFASTAVVDKAAPVPMTLLIQDGSSDIGRPGKGDRVRVAFSENLAVTSICPTWNGDTAAQSIVTPGVATVRIRDNATAPSTTFDQLTVSTSSSACDGVLRFGTIVLGSVKFVTADVDFGGASPNETKINWTPRTDTTLAEILITVGSPSPDKTDRDNASSTKAVYSPAPELRDLAGNGPASSSTSTAKQF